MSKREKIYDELKKKRDEDVEKTRVYSFDIRRMRDDLQKGDVLAKIIRTHLYLEHILVEMLLESFVVKTAIDLKRMTFSAKLNLCIATGLMPHEWLGTITKINKIRNEAAHTLFLELGSEQVQNIWDALPSEAQDAWLSDHNSSKYPIPTLEKILGLIIIYTDIQRQEAAARRVEIKYRREYMRIATENALKFLAKIEKDDNSIQE